MNEVPPPDGSSTDPVMYDPAAIVAAFATYRDPARSQRVRPWHRRDSFRPHPYTSERNFAVHRAVLEGHMPNAGTILEIGAGGAANYTKILARKGRRVIAGDISPEQLRELRASLAGHRADAWTQTLEMDVSRLPLADQSVDAVVCIGGVLSYVFDAAPLAVSEIHRVLVPGGRAVVSVMTPGWITSPEMGYEHIFSEARFAEVVATGDVQGPELDEADHRYRCYTTARLSDVLDAGGLRVLDCLASHIDGVAADVPLDRYIAACHDPRARDSTRGYLIAVVERSA